MACILVVWPGAASSPPTPIEEYVSCMQLSRTPAVGQPTLQSSAPAPCNCPPPFPLHKPPRPTPRPRAPETWVFSPASTSPAIHLPHTCPKASPSLNQALSVNNFFAAGIRDLRRIAGAPGAQTRFALTTTGPLANLDPTLIIFTLYAPLDALVAELLRTLPGLSSPRQLADIVRRVTARPNILRAPHAIHMSSSPSQMSLPERRARVLTLFEQLNKHLPLTLDGSSPNASDFRTAATDATQSIQLIINPPPAGGSGDGDGDGDDGGDDGGDAEGAPDKPAKPATNATALRLKRAEKRFGNIMAVAGHPAIDVDEFVRHITDPIHGDRRELEDAALKRLVRGHDGSAGSNAWVGAHLVRTCLPTNRRLQIKGLGRLFKQQAQASLTDEIAAHHQRNRLLLAARLTANQRALQQGFEVSHAARSTQHILEHICVASFGIDWLTMTGENSNRDKAAFYTAAYQDLPVHRAFFQALTPAERDQQMVNEHQDSYRLWRNKLEPEITARNRFVALYKAFGPVVFIDPFWHVKGLTNNARTKEFPLLLTLLLNNLPHEPDHDDPDATTAQVRYRPSRKAVEGTLRAIDPALWHYARDFFADSPDNIVQ
ncbi:hypothetical protein DFH09DRAFT_1286102 [Mycena vulgaris]|nr:hypothetical protein DFH09DRAFT_1286102 [Mycena vulgaris]